MSDDIGTDRDTDTTTDSRPAPQPRRRSRTLTTWLSGGVVGFALSAALIGGAAFAQTDTSATDYGQAFIDNLAENLGITSDELETAIDDAGNETVDEALANGDLTDEQAERMRERIESGAGLGGFGFGSDDPGEFGHSHGHGHRLFGHGVALDTLATTLGISEDDLRAEIESGATLEEIITGHGSTVDEVVDALVAEAQTKLDTAVADGRITQEQADEMLAELPDRLTQMIESGLPGPGFHFDRWSDDDNSDNDTDDSEATPEAEETSSEA